METWEETTNCVSLIEDDFYMSVCSHPSNFTDFNQLNNFQITLPSPLHFGGDFEVSLCDFIFPIKWNTLPLDECRFYVKVVPSISYKNSGEYFPFTPENESEDKYSTISTISLQDGWFISGEEFAQHLNNSLGPTPKPIIIKERRGEEAGGNEDEGEIVKYVNINLQTHIKFNYNKITQSFSINFTSDKEYISVMFNSPLADLLGVPANIFLPENENYAGETHNSKSVIYSQFLPLFFTNHQSQMHITCLEVQPEFLFDRYINLLSSIYLEQEVRWGAKGRNVYQAYERKYKRLKSRNIYSLHFNILNSDFNHFPFSSAHSELWHSTDEVLMNLHFRPSLFNHHT